MTDFIGAGRRQLVDELVTAFDEVTMGLGPRLVLLRAMSGEGKTRVVQEFYRRLSASEPTPHYWPPALADNVDWKTGRKQLAVPSFTPEPKAEMPWLYWSVSCSRRADGSLEHALSSNASQFAVHADYLFERFGVKEVAKHGYDNSGAVVGLLGLIGLAIPPVSVAMTVVNLAKTGLENRDLILKLKQRRERRQEQEEGTRTIDWSSHGRENEAEELASDVAKISETIPVVIAVDDVHWADEFTVHFLDQVLRRQDSKVLVVATAWPEDREGQASPIAAWLTSVDGAPDGRLVEVRDVAPLSSNDLSDLVRLNYAKLTAESDPKLDSAVTARIVNQFTTPMGIRAFFGLQKVQKRIHRGGLRLSDLENLPGDITKVIDAYWEELPAEIQAVLAVAAVMGEHFAPPPVAVAAIALDQPDALTLLQRARSPFGVTRAMPELLETFTDYLFHHSALANSESLFVDDEFAVIYDALAAYAGSLDVATSPRQLCTTVWSAHVALTLSDLKEQIDRDLASISAWKLAELCASTYALTDAIRNGKLSLEWSPEPTDGEVNLERRSSLASWYLEGGGVNEAISMFKMVLEDRLRMLGPDHPATMNARSNLATALRHRGRFEEIIPMVEALLEDQRRVLGPDHPSTLITHNDLARYIGDAGRLDEAIPMLEALLEDQRRVLGPDHPSTLITHSNLARFIGDAGRLDEAIPMLEALLGDQRRVLGPDHPATMITRNTLAIFIGDAGRLDEAIPMLEALLGDQRRVLGPDHPATMMTRHNLARFIGYAGRFDEAIPMLEALLEDRLRVLGPEHPSTMITRYTLARFIGDAGRLDEAIPMLEALLGDRLRVLGPEHSDSMITRNTLALFIGDAGRLDDAIPMLEALLEDRQRLLGPDHPNTMITRHDLARLIGDAGRLDDAIPMLEALLEDQLRVLGPDHPNTMTTARDLTSALLTRGGPSARPTRL